MYLVIPSGGYPPPQPPPYHPPQHPSGTTYTVRPGDTLSSIAWQFGTTVEAIASYNGIWNPNHIYWGMVLQIPASRWHQ
jgi:LysM repeat protein